VFHAGERLVQTRAGVAERSAQRGSRVIRNHMPDEHRSFFATLRYVFAATLDDAGYPQANLLTGAPGMMTSPDSQHLILGGFATALPMARLRAGDAMALLGLDFETARRNRANGTVVTAENGRLALRIHQSFGNCSQYVHRRVPEQGRSATPATDFRAVVTHAETFFIASRSADIDAEMRGGLDVSHRGGMPGFVRWLNDHTLAFDDYSGNNFFNTLGNIVDDPRASMMFVDFSSGKTWRASGHAQLIWGAAANPAQPPQTGARQVRFTIVSVTAGEPLQALQWVLTAPAREFEGTASLSDVAMKPEVPP
jgi:predicted pyridoxine 5'-phosphate oxidase superfamily flavin-nucleotide-binding protein